jgi:hypothetical protein
MLDIVVSTIGSAGLIAVLAWLCRTWVKERLTSSIRLETDKNLAKFKMEMESESNRIKDFLAAGTAANSKVESTLLEHRINAIKKVWESVLSWQKASSITMMASVLSDDWIKKYSTDPGTKSTFDNILKSIDHDSFMSEQSKTESVRPFLPEATWAIYAAHHAFLSTRLAKAVLLTISSVDHSAIKWQTLERELVKKSAPADVFKIYENNPITGTERYLGYLREKLLSDFREMLSGQLAGQRAVSDAAEILGAAEALVKSPFEKPN